VPIRWLQLHLQPSELQFGKPLQVVGQGATWTFAEVHVDHRQVVGAVNAIRVVLVGQINAVYVLAIPGEVQHNPVRLLLVLFQHSGDAAGYLHCCLLQPAVGPSSAEQAAEIVCASAHHCQQDAVWQ
jgi:hypothetical protein